MIDVLVGLVFVLLVAASALYSVDTRDGRDWQARDACTPRRGD